MKSRPWQITRLRLNKSQHQYQTQRYSNNISVVLNDIEVKFDLLMLHYITKKVRSNSILSPIVLGTV
jgi:hypothetical protein